MITKLSRLCVAALSIMAAREEPAPGRLWLARELHRAGYHANVYREITSLLSAGMLARVPDHPAACHPSVGALILTTRGRQALAERIAEEWASA